MSKPTPRELLEQAQKLTAALADFTPEVLVAEGMALLNAPEVQVLIGNLDTIQMSLPEGHQMRRVFNQIIQGVRVAKTVVDHERTMAEAKASQAAGATG